MSLITADDKRLVWTGAISLQRTDAWVMPWRLPHADLDLFPFDVLQQSAAMPSGVCLRLSSDARTITLLTEPMAVAGVIDLCCAGETRSVPFAPGSTAIHLSDLAAGMKELAIWLHQTAPFRLRGIELPAGARLERSAGTLPRGVIYGSSITFCMRTQSPSLSWPCIVARRLGFELTNLGFGGQCHLDPLVARLIRDLPADIVMIEAGINIYGNSSLNDRTFLAALLGAIATIREGHPSCPFIVCSPICSPARETTPNTAGLTLQRMREYVAEGVHIFRQRGDTQLHYVDGLDLFGADLAGYLVDGVHPGIEGNLLLAENAVRILQAIVR